MMRKYACELLLIVLAGILAVAVAASHFPTSMPAPPAFAKVKADYQISDAILLDRHGQILHEMRIDPAGRRLAWIALRDISPAFLRAVIQAEDRRFPEHRGVDWRAFGAALYEGIKEGRLRGASTITMQVASRLDEKARPLGIRRAWREKWRQIRYAGEIEKTWTKNEILEVYLNLITFRGELQGIAAASRSLFDKEPSGLNETEALILASLIPSAGHSLDAVAKRAWALSRSLQAPADYEILRAIVHEKIGRPYRIRPRVALAPHVARMLLKNPGERIASTLDARLQERVYDILNRQLTELKGRNVHDGAVLVLDNGTGDVLSYVANSGESASAPFVDGIRAVRQAGSSLKPFLYGLALEKELLTAASLLEDGPLQIATPTGLYIPENYSHEFLGRVSVRTALASSLNIPAVRTLLLVGGDAFVERLRALGCESVREEADYYGYSLALGSVDIRLWELANAYRALANGGRWQPLRLQAGEKICRPQPVMDEKAAFIITDILADRESRSATFGLENLLATPFFSAVKTGTSKDMRDNWCIGYSDRFTVGVWVGNFSGEPMWNVSGMSGAAPIWLEIMRYLHLSAPSRPPRIPGGIVATRIEFPHGVEPARAEWFIAGTEPANRISLSETYEKPAIVYPPEGAIIALDPDIPEHLQSVPFQAAPSKGHFVWYLDAHKVGQGTPCLWKPERGEHVLAIAGGDGRMLHSIRFAVR